MVFRHFGRQKLRVFVVGHVHGDCFSVRDTDVQNCMRCMQEARHWWRPCQQQCPSNAPMFLARSTVGKRRAASQIRETPSHNRVVIRLQVRTVVYGIVLQEEEKYLRSKWMELDTAIFVTNLKFWSCFVHIILLCCTYLCIMVYCRLLYRYTLREVTATRSVTL